MRLHSFQHVPFEGLGNIEKWAQGKGVSITTTSFWNNPVLPNADDFDFLVVMGGPMNIYEEKKHPWLRQEKKAIEQAIIKGKMVMGVCLGAQLIADVLGAKVTQNPEKEIGWFPMRWTPEARKLSLFEFFPETMTVFHWHGDTFNLPEGAVPLAESEGCKNQAFLYHNHVLALQFHMETTSESASLLLAHCKDELKPGKYIQAEEAIRSEIRHYPLLEKRLYQLLDHWMKKERD